MTKDVTTDRGRELVREFLIEADPGLWYVTPRRVLNEIDVVGHAQTPANVDCRGVAKVFGCIHRDEFDEDDESDDDDPLLNISPEKWGDGSPTTWRVEVPE
jgi:hypothetical protein